MDWFRIAVIILVIVKTIEFSYRFYKWIKNKKIRTLKINLKVLIFNTHLGT